MILDSVSYKFLTFMKVYGVLKQAKKDYVNPQKPDLVMEASLSTLPRSRYGSFADRSDALNQAYDDFTVAAMVYAESCSKESLVSFEEKNCIMKHEWTKLYSAKDSIRNPGENILLGHRCIKCDATIGDWRERFPHWYSNPISGEPPVEILDLLRFSNCSGIGGQWFETYGPNENRPKTEKLSLFARIKRYILGDTKISRM